MLGVCSPALRDYDPGVGRADAGAGGVIPHKSEPCAVGPVVPYKCMWDDQEFLLAEYSFCSFGVKNFQTEL